MESLLCEPGPKNPLIFLSLSLVNRIPGYNPDEKETLNQLDCIKDLIESVSASVFRLDSTRNSIAVAIDALITISVSEAKKSTHIRISALKCLNLIVEKLSACGINCIGEFIPGILSKMAKISIGRVNVEVGEVIHQVLEIIMRIIGCFWEEQDDWIVSKEEASEKIVILKQHFKNNVDGIVSSLRPLLQSQRFNEDLMKIFIIHLNGCINPSISTLKLYLLLLEDMKLVNFSNYLHQKKFIQLYNVEIIEWFEDNSESLESIHEEIVLERLKLLSGLMRLKDSHKFLLIKDLFSIIKRLTKLKVSIGDTISIEYSTIAPNGIEHALSVKNEEFLPIPEIKFKRNLNYSKELNEIVDNLFEKMIKNDSVSVQTFLLQFDDSTIEEVIQKIDLSSFYHSSTFKIDSSLDLFKDSLKYLERSFYPVEQIQMIHLATIKLLWSCKFGDFHKTIRPNLLVILSGMTSDWIILREVSTQILIGISKNKGVNLRELLAQNEKFLLDRLGIQLSLPSLYPSTPKIISCLVRNVLTPSLALKFTDLLVKKVSDNLSTYQRHPAYCKDLISVAKETIEIISKTESIKFDDPKDFAFSKNESNSEDEKVEEDNTLRPLNCQQKIICYYLKIASNFILSDSKSIRSNSINLVKVSVENFNSSSESSELCQLIHVAWPNMISVLKDLINTSDPVQLDLIVLEAFRNCCKVLFEKLPLFMRDRFVKDYWRSNLKNYKRINSTNFTPIIKISEYLLDTLNFGLIYCKPSTEICLEILDYVKGINNRTDIFQSLWNLEPDIIWYYYSIELGNLKEISSKSSELKSFIMPKCKKETKNNILKQFIQ